MRSPIIGSIQDGNDEEEGDELYYDEEEDSADSPIKNEEVQ